MEQEIAYWIRSEGMGQREVVMVYVCGPCQRSDEGIVGHDVRVRPVRLGVGEYTMVVAPDSLTNWVEVGDILIS